MYYVRSVLTFDIDDDPLADRRWHSVRRDAQVRTHFHPADAGQV
jgi:hypothetical protein